MAFLPIEREEKMEKKFPGLFTYMKMKNLSSSICGGRTG